MAAHPSSKHPITANTIAGALVLSLGLHLARGSGNRLYPLRADDPLPCFLRAGILDHAPSAWLKAKRKKVNGVATLQAPSR